MNEETACVESVAPDQDNKKNPKTTTISTIAVKSGKTKLVIALLQVSFIGYFVIFKPIQRFLSGELLPRTASKHPGQNKAKYIIMVFIFFLDLNV